MEAEIRLAIRISATPAAVWDTLTNHAKIARYMYGAIARTNWQSGHPVHYYFSQDGQETLVVKGEVVRAEAPFCLEHTLFPTTWSLLDASENYLNVIYRLTPSGAETELSVVQYDFSQVAAGEKRYNDAVNGWRGILPKVKAVAENIH